MMQTQSFEPSRIYSGLGTRMGRGRDLVVRASLLDMPGRERVREKAQAIGVGIGIMGGAAASMQAASVSDPTTIISSVPLLAWYRGDTVVQSGGFVSQWTDKKNTNHAVQATGGNQPAYNATDSTLSNQPTLTGNGTSTEILCSGTLPASYWICCVLKILSFTANCCAFSSPGGGGKAQIYWNGATALYLFENGTPAGPVSGAPIGSWKRVACAQSNASTDFIHAGSTSATANCGRSASSALWRFFGLGGSQWWNGAIAEAIITTGIPTSGEQTAIDTYLSGRYLASILT